jgi:DNA-binding transcriptional ArsR family regulator
MFDLRLVEIPLPGTERDVDNLVSWIIDTMCLLRRRGEATADGDTFSPIHRILKEHLLANPSKGHETRDLADDLALTPAAIHHHFTRLVSAGLVSSTSGNGWRRYHLSGGTLANAINSMATMAVLVHQHRLANISTDWQRGDDVRMDIELPADDSGMASIRVREWAPASEGESDFSRCMADIGLLGERPGKEMLADSISVRLYRMLLATPHPLSIDEAAAAIDAPKPRVGRILERFRQTGLVERVPRTDRLATALWTAMNTQYGRRGEDWMLKKGGFERLSAPNSIFKRLKKGNLTPEIVAKELKKMDAREQMLLLNLLGGRLPLGHRLVGESVTMHCKRGSEPLDRILRRIRRVAQMLEKAMS